MFPLSQWGPSQLRDRVLVGRGGGPRVPSTLRGHSQKPCTGGLGHSGDQEGVRRWQSSACFDRTANGRVSVERSWFCDLSCGQGSWGWSVFVRDHRGHRFGPRSLLDIRLEIWVAAAYLKLALDKRPGREMAPEDVTQGGRILCRQPSDFSRAPNPPGPLRPWQPDGGSHPAATGVAAPILRSEHPRTEWAMADDVGSPLRVVSI